MRGLDGAGFSAQAPLAGGRGNGFGGGTTGAARGGAARALRRVGRLRDGRQRLLRLGVGRPAGAGRRDRRRSSRATRAFAAAASSCAPSTPQFFIFNSYRGQRLPRPARPGRGPEGRPRRLRAGRLRRATSGRCRHPARAAVLRRVREREPAQRDVAVQLQPADDHRTGRTPPNAPSPSRSFVRGGIDYRPLPELAFKVDLQIALDGEAAAADGTGDGRRGARNAAPAHADNWPRRRAASRGWVWPSASRSDDHHASILHHPVFGCGTWASRPRSSTRRSACSRCSASCRRRCTTAISSAPGRAASRATTRAKRRGPCRRRPAPRPAAPAAGPVDRRSGGRGRPPADRRPDDVS